MILKAFVVDDGAVDDVAVDDAVVVAGATGGVLVAERLIEYSTGAMADGPVTFRGGSILPLTFRG